MLTACSRNRIYDASIRRHCIIRKRINDVKTEAVPLAQEIRLVIPPERDQRTLNPEISGPGNEACCSVPPAKAALDDVMASV
jgi:hypothetical protein